MNNTIEFNDSGEEHYEHLLFYSVERFGLEAYEKLDEGIRKNKSYTLRGMIFLLVFWDSTETVG